MHRISILLVAAALAGCARDEILHGLDEGQANAVLVALDEGGVPAEKTREDGAEERWRVEVAATDAARAHRILAERELPRTRPPGFDDVFGKGSMVPTPTEEHALFLHALGGELARSVETIDGVVEARVHVGLRQADPLRVSEPVAPRAAVLVKCRASACAAIRTLEPGIRAMVAGAVEGLDPAAVALVVAEAAQPAAAPRPASRRSAVVLVGIAIVTALAALALAAPALRARLRREVTS